MPRKSILENVQVGVHGDLTAKVIDRDGNETKEYTALHVEMNSHFNNDQMSTVIPYHPQSGQICVGKVGTVWHRVRVDGQIGLKAGLHASCFLIDEGTNHQIPVPNLRQIPTIFAQFPHQIKHLSLYGIKPLSLQISSEDLMVYERPVFKWDSSAVRFMTDHIKAAVYIKAKTVSRSADGVLSVMMYLYTRSGNRVCLNDALVVQRYAASAEHEDTPTLPMQKYKKSSSSLTSLRMPRMDSDGDTARSDVELSVYKHELLERGCMTDSEAVSAISHRNLPRVISTSKRNALKHSQTSQNGTDEEVKQVQKEVPNANVNHVYDSQSSERTSKMIPSSEPSVQRLSCSSNCNSANAYSNYNCTTNKLPYKTELTGSSVHEGDYEMDHVRDSLSVSSHGYSTSKVTGPLQGDTLNTHGRSPISNNDEISPMRGKIGAVNISSTPKQQRTSTTSPLQALGRGSPVFGRGALFKIISPNSSSPPSPGQHFLRNNQNDNNAIKRETSKGELFANVVDKVDQALRKSSIASLNGQVLNESICDKQSGMTTKHDNSNVLDSELFEDTSKESLRNQWRNYTSGSETSASCMSTLAASVTNQMQHSRRPGQATSITYDDRETNFVSGNESSDMQWSRQHVDVMERDGPNATEYSKQATNSRISSSDSDSIMFKNDMMMGKESKDKQPVFILPKVAKSNNMVQEQLSQSSILSNGGTSTDKRAELMAKFTGDKLLKELSTGFAGNTQDVTGAIAKPSKTKTEALGMVDNVLVHGKAPKKPIYDIERFPFIHEITKHWEYHKFVSPKLIQSYGWPAVMSGRHIISISPPRSGKTFTYLYALINFLAGSNMYKELPAGMGPLVIILCKSWRRAEGVYHATSQVIQGRKTKVLLVYGGGQEENRAFELINGCDILITTPPSLKRLLEKGYTDLRRLCHLVIDDCEHTLDTFHVEINYIKMEYSLVIQNQTQGLECPRQILVFGSQWTQVNSQFTENVLNDPILIVTSPFEAAIYGRVRQIPHICKTDDRMREVLGLLENIAGTEHRIIIFSSSMEDIRFLTGSLKAYTYDMIVVSEHMELYDVKVIADEWAHGRSKLLVCSDNHVMNVNIVNATVLIHYDLPNSKTKFGNRMSCMRQLFYNFTTAHKKTTLEPVSHLLITENCAPHVRTIQELLKRSQAEIPRELKAFLAGMVERREQDENKELCYQLLAYGTCRDKWRCGCRHIVIPELDTSPKTEWLPNEGHVKVLVTHVNDNDASHFYARLLNITREDGTESEPALTYMRLMMDLELHYRKSENQKRNTAPFTGDLCAYQDRGVFYRVQIQDIPNMNTHERGTGSIEVSVKFVDIGKDMDIDVNKLYELPIQFRDVPFQAVEVFVCKIKPVDKDPEWTIRASVFLNELLYGKEFEGKIVLRLGGILWLDPLVERVYLGETRAIINRSYVNVELVRNGFANENPTHLEKLYKLCQGKVEIPRLLLAKTKMSPILQTDSLPLCRQYHDVHVSSVTSPDMFFVQRREKLSDLEDLMEEIANYVHQLEADDGIKDMKTGQYCLAQYDSFDKRWYRARIMNVLEEEYEIMFADYGDLDTVPKDKVKELPVDKFFELPLQAIECKLAGVATDKKHEKKSGDALWDLTHFVNGDLKLLVTTVKSQIAAEYSGRHRFVVDMFDTSGCQDLNLAQELVYRCLVFPTEDSVFDDLFPKPVGLRRKIYSLPIDKVTDMAALLYWESDSVKALEISRQLLDLIKSSVTRLTQSNQSSLITALQSLAKLIGRVQWLSVEVAVEDSVLELLSAGDGLCEEFLQSSCLSSVTRCLEMENNSPMQCQAAYFLSSLCAVSTRIRNDIQSYSSKVLFTLNELFEYTQHEEIKGAICKAFVGLVSGSDSVFQMLMDKSVCMKLKSILSECDSHDVREAAILLLSALSDHDGSHSDLKKESLIEVIVSNLKSTNCDKCIQHSVEFCAHYASTRRKHKTHLLEMEMVPILDRLMKLDIQTTTKQQCKDLTSSLVIKFPSEPISGVQHFSEERSSQNAEREVAPETHWCQTTFVVQLSVKIPECTCTQNSFTFTEQAVQFRDTIKGVRYAFHLDLFDKITPAKCKVAVKAHEVLVSLHKSVKGRWTRLHRGKQKPRWIFVDYERFVDSSSDMDSYDEDRPFVFKKKKKKTKKLQPDRSTASAYRVRSSESDSEDSLDDNDFRDDFREDRDEFDIFS